MGSLVTSKRANIAASSASLVRSDSIALQQDADMQGRKAVAEAKD